MRLARDACTLGSLLPRLPGGINPKTLSLVLPAAALGRAHTFAKGSVRTLSPYSGHSAQLAEWTGKGVSGQSQSLSLHLDLSKRPGLMLYLSGEPVSQLLRAGLSHWKTNCPLLSLLAG